MAAESSWWARVPKNVNYTPLFIPLFLSILTFQSQYFVSLALISGKYF